MYCSKWRNIECEGRGGLRGGEKVQAALLSSNFKVTNVFSFCCMKKTVKFHSSNGKSGVEEKITRNSSFILTLLLSLPSL